MISRILNSTNISCRDSDQGFYKVETPILPVEIPIGDSAGRNSDRSLY